MRFTIDSNVLVYGQQHVPDLSDIARSILNRLPGLDVMFTTQALAEFLKIVRQKNFAELPKALEEVALWSLVFPCVATEPADLIVAARFSVRYKLQFWDSVILTVASGAGAQLMLSEDMQDGATYDGVKVINPFLTTNRATLDALLTPQS